MNNHIYKNIILKKADIDLDIIPIVQWLNNFHTVFTTWSCQGDESVTENTDYSLPYINFICGDLEEIKIIKKFIDKALLKGADLKFGCDIKYDNNMSISQYYIHFSKKEELYKLLETIIESYIEETK